MSLTSAPANAHVYEKRSVFKTTADKMMAFHQDPSALGKLTPPPMFMQLIRDDRTSITEGEIEFTLWLPLSRFAGLHAMSKAPRLHRSRIA